jgi:hypothetical protein
MLEANKAALAAQTQSDILTIRLQELDMVAGLLTSISLQVMTDITRCFLHCITKGLTGCSDLRICDADIHWYGVRTSE